MFPKNHRLLTPGHDPLIGMIVGVFDILRGGRTAVDPNGAVQFDSGLAEPESNPLVAVTQWVLHLISDVATPMGLPAPGWTLTPLLQVGSFGENQRTVADLARFMYLKGYDLRHLLASAAAPLAIELPLAAYVAGRRYFEAKYDEEWVAASASGKRRRHPRQIGLRLIADAIACTANAGKIAIYGGNPLAFNYAQWLSLVHSAVRYAAHSWSRPTEVLVERATRSEEIRTRDWDDLWVWHTGNRPAPVRR